MGHGRLWPITPTPTFSARGGAVTKKRNRAYRRQRAQQKPTKAKALRRVAMFEALWDAVTRGADHDDRA